jgi:EAL domain-containing protein (putative c-di-GMP-specific phosphodiesterase class I)
LIEPNRFIPIAEQTNLILQIGKGAAHGLRKNVAWQRAGMRAFASR